MEVFNCAYTELVSLHNLKPHPKNTNEHPRKQIELLAEIIKYQGQRLPIVVSKLSGYITKGHGRLMAIQELGWEKGAVDYQEYADETQEYADMEADNRIAELAERDEAKFQENLKLIPLDFDLKLMGNPDLKPLAVDEAPSVPVEAIPKWIIEVQFPNEMELRDIYDDLISRGYMAKVKK